MDDVGDMEGMSSGSASMFKPTNMYIARVYWCLIAAFVGLLGFRRVVRSCATLMQKRRLRHQPSSVPSLRPSNLLTKSYATATALFRETTYPQPLYFTGRLTRFFTPPPVGQCLLLALYWTVLLAMLWSNTILGPSSPLYAYKWEIVGFRAAWVSITQLPLIYCLSCKINPISIVTGISYERINWLHRWAARTLFLTVTVHWAFFYREWDVARIVSLELQMMPMVKYGFGAWAVLGWLVLSGFGFFRQANYEVFVLQHIAAAVVLLWLVHMHVPSYAAYNVWFSVALLALDRGARFLLALWRNLHLAHTAPRAHSRHLLGYETEAESLDDGYVLLRIKDINFRWRAGQHINILVPRLGLVQTHPFTIANTFVSPSDKHEIQLYIKAQSGMTKRLYRRALGLGRHPPLRCLRTFVIGPWGSPPSLTGHETVVFVATSTGIAFTLPLLESLCRDGPSAVQRIRFHWIVRHAHQIACFRRRLLVVLKESERRGGDVRVTVHVSGSAESPMEEGPRSETEEASSSFLEAEKCVESADLIVSSPSSKRRDEESDIFSTATSFKGSSPPSLLPRLHFKTGRPSLDSLLRPPIEQAFGESAVIACGATAFTAELRNYVAGLSDERAVHKGSGAQGIFLFAETFGW